MTSTAVVLGMAPVGKLWPAPVCDCAKDGTGSTAISKAIMNFMVVSSRFSFIWYHWVPLKKWYHRVPAPSRSGMNKTSISKRRQEGEDETPVRERILEAA